MTTADRPATSPMGISEDTRPGSRIPLHDIVATT
ncbi:Uncharacterised protein [Mycobacterium tuberculosis]|nr:Uncharacterised protein [Mycobacterium tuberculosis]